MTTTDTGILILALFGASAYVLDLVLCRPRRVIARGDTRALDCQCVTIQRRKAS